jgi:multidrug efflux pump subunit AcrA (membrane-fusion protein)
MRTNRLKTLICAVALFATVSCGSSGGNSGKRGNSNSVENPQNAAITITVGKSESRDVASVIQATGSLVANETSDVAPKVAGKISNIGVNVGQLVSAGTVIAKIDDRDARLRLATAQAGVKQAQAGVKQAEARLGLLDGSRFSASLVPEVLAADANYRQALAEQKQAEANEKRYRELTETGDVAMVTYETYRTARDTARAKANAAKQQLDSAVNSAKQSNQAIVTAQANVESAATQVVDAQQAIADTVIKAPFAGYVSNRPAAVGEYVSSASIIATILRTNPIKIQIQVAEADVPHVTLGKGVSLEVDAYKDRKFAGTVSAINPAVDPNSRSAIVEALVENNENALRTGMFAMAKISRDGGGKAVFVPKSAVFNDQTTQSFRVFVIKDGIAKLSVVQIGTDEGEFQQIISGVNPDETVATSNLDKLYEGAKVSF